MEKISWNFTEEGILSNNLTTQEDLYKAIDDSSEKILSDLSKLKNNMENLEEYNESLLEANKLVRTILKDPYESNITLMEKVNSLLYKFLAPIYKDESLQKSYAKILSILDLANGTEITPEEVQLWITQVLRDSKLPYIIKQNFVTWLKEKDFLMGDPLERVKIQNYCATNFPQYNWETFQLTLDPKDNSIVYTDMFEYK